MTDNIIEALDPTWQHLRYESWTFLGHFCILHHSGSPKCETIVGNSSIQIQMQNSNLSYLYSGYLHHHINIHMIFLDLPAYKVQFLLIWIVMHVFQYSLVHLSWAKFFHAHFAPTRSTCDYWIPIKLAFNSMTAASSMSFYVSHAETASITLPQPLIWGFLSSHPYHTSVIFSYLSSLSWTYTIISSVFQFHFLPHSVWI